MTKLPLPEDLAKTIVDLWKDDALTVIETTGWGDDGKYQYKTDYVEHGGNFYCIGQSRSGSYYSDYHYGETTIYRASYEEKTITIKEWTDLSDMVSFEPKW